MRKIHLLGLTLFAVFAFSVVAVSSASAFSELESLAAQFLSGGNPIAVGAKLPTDTTNTGTTLLLLEDMSAPGGAVDVECSGLFEGEINGPEDGLITKVVGLPTPQSSDILCPFGTNKGLCTGVEGTTEALVEAVNLPWLVTPLLVVDLEGHNFFWLMIEADEHGEPGYLVECKVGLGNIDDTCTGAVNAEAVNTGTGIEGTFKELDEQITPPGLCTQSNARSGLLAGSGLTVDTGDTGLLAISST
jgi:hypothetical protein